MSNDEGYVGTNKWAIVKSALMKYTGSSFIRELIQNAEDAGNEAKEKVTICFDFKEKELVVENNMKFVGDFTHLVENVREFESSQGTPNEDAVQNRIKSDDWVRICISRGDLKNLDKEKNKGRFGIGFRSVFKICDAVTIESDYKKLDYNNPLHYRKDKSNVEKTKFTFPYRLTQSEVGVKINASPVTKQQLETYYNDALNSKMFILFLDNIGEIDILRNSKLVKKISRTSRKDKIEIKENDLLKNKETISTFKVFRNKDSSAELLFPTNEADISFRYKIYSWFPTKYETQLPFYINANFEVDDSRDSFNANESEYNNNQLKVCGQILLDNIDEIKELFDTPYSFYEFLIFRHQLHCDLLQLKKVLYEGLKKSNFKVIHTKAGWKNCSDSYFVDADILGNHSGLVFLFEKNEGMNYFDCYDHRYFEDYYDFLKDIYPLKIYGKEKVLQYLSKIPINKRLSETQIENISNIISIYNYLVDKNHNIHEIRKLPIFLDHNQMFSHYSSLYRIPAYLSDIAKLFNVKSAFICKEYNDELIKFYRDVGLAEFSVLKIIEIIKSYNISDELHIQKAPAPLNDILNILLLLKVISKESDSPKDLKVPLLLDTVNHIHYTNSNEIYVIRNDEKLQQFFTKWGIPILHEKFIEFGYLAKNFNIVHFLKILETRHEKMTRSDLINAYAVINSYKQDIRSDQGKIDVLFRLPIFYTTGNKRVCLNNEEVFFLDFDGYKPEKDIFIDKSVFESDQLEGFREFLLHIGAKKYNYNEFAKKYLAEIYISAAYKQKVEMLKQLLVNRSQLKSDTMDILKKITLFYCDDKQYHSAEENVFFRDEDLIEIFGEQLRYLAIPNELVTEHKAELEILGVLKQPTGRFMSNAISNLTKKKDANRLLKVIGYFISNYDSFKAEEDLGIVSELPCIPDHNLNLKKGDQIFSSNLTQQLDELPNISYLHKDLGNPKREINEFFGIKSIVPTELIVENLQVSVKHRRKKSYLEIYRILNDRVKDNRIQLQKLFEFPSIAIPIYKESKLVEVHFYKPSRIFRESTYLDRIGSKYVQVLPKEYAPFFKIFEYLNVKTAIDIETMMLILEEIKSFSRLEESGKIVIKNIYGTISELVKNKDNRINQLSRYTDKDIILVNNQFKKPSEVFLNDNNEVADLFIGTNVENLILPIDPDVNHFYHKMGISMLSQVIKFNTHEFKNQKKNDWFSEKVHNIFTNREEIQTYAQREFRRDNDYFDLIESKLKKFQIMSVFVADEIIVDVSIPGIMIKPTINKKSIKSLINENMIYISNKINKTDQLWRLSKEISYFICADGSLSDLLERILNYEDNEQIKNFFRERHGVTVESSKGYEKVDGGVPISSEPTTEKGESYESDEKQEEKNDIWGEGYVSQAPQKTPIEESDDTDSEEETAIRKGRTDSPTQKTDFKEKVKKIFDGKVAPVGQSSPIKDKEELSSQEEQAGENNIRKELKDEVRNVRDDNLRRGYVTTLNTLGDDQTSKEEVRGFYDGKCQICNFTFRDREGKNHCKIVHLLPKSHQGVRFAGNLLCLCPNHAAMHQCRVIDYKGLEDLIPNRVNIKINGKVEQIHFTNLHYKMFKIMFGIK